MYAVYCHNYYQAVDRLAYVRAHNQELHDFIEQREEKSEHVTLPSLLIKPVQRICKYPLLFATLLRELKGVGAGGGNAKHVDELKKVAEVVDAIADSVNRYVGESDTMEHMLHVFEELGGEKGAPGLMQAHRRFVRTDDVTFVDMGDKAEHHRILYLFNDVLVVAKPVAPGSAGGSSNTLTKKLSIQKLTRSLSGSRKSLPSDSKMSHVGIAKLEHWFDVEQMTVAPADVKGIAIKYVSHHVDDTHKRRTLIRSKHATSGSSKIVTAIEKFEIRLSNTADRDSLFQDITKQIETQESLSDGQKKAEAEVGAPRKQHSWARGGHKASGGFDSLQDIAAKYSNSSNSPMPAKKG